MSVLVSIIIVNYNGKKFLADCINSIFGFADCRYEVIVVDNASTDGSREYLREHFPDLRLIHSEVNLGFAGANNLGARSASGKYLLLLNNDTRLLNGLGPAIEALESDEKLGAVGCRMYFADGSFQPSKGYEHAPLRLVLAWTGLYRLTSLALFSEVDLDPANYNSLRQAVAWVSGAFLMTPRDLWEKLGGLDESYFMYVEDADYCRRVRDAGFSVAYTPQTEIIHYRGGGAAWLGPDLLPMLMDSYVVYARKFYSLASVLFLRVALGSIMGARAAIFSMASLLVDSQSLAGKGRAFLSAAARLFAGGSKRRP